MRINYSFKTRHCICVSIYIITLYLFLMGWSLLPNALQPCKLYCGPPNFGIRTLICRLNFAQRPIFSGLRFFKESEISGVLRPQKIHRPQLGLNPRTLDLEADYFITLTLKLRTQECRDLAIT